MSSIFISYSRKDIDFARFLAEQLEAAGFTCWIDFDKIESGAQWLKRIQEGIETSDAFVVVMSRAARDSEWVERETLMAMELHKPLHIALIGDLPLPLHLINRQFIDFREDQEQAVGRLAAALRQHKTAAPASLSPEPSENNFFTYIAQITRSESEALIARDLYHWAKQQADEVAFGGKVTPAYHVRIGLGDNTLTVFSVWAYSRRPAAQIYFQYLAEVAPYTDVHLRRSTLVSLNRLLSPENQIIEDKADRRPTIPLSTMDSAEKLETFQQIMAEIFENLRSN
ncbi:MAG: toll/interleukin-1 receptor domain-containing protein [Chitinophagaceae bacterium]|nr:toll/interleukin-1 receptor domain-containing protein [Anaerolineae bacterium]